MTMQVIQHIELGSAAAQIDFDSIPTDGTDLFIACSIRTNRAAVADLLAIRFNGVTTGYSRRSLEGSGSSALSGSASDGFVGVINGNNTTSSTFSSIGIYVPNYRSSTAKSISADAVHEQNATEAYQTLAAVLWDNTAAITSVRLFSLLGTSFLTGSSATLYKVTKGSDGTTTVS